MNHARAVALAFLVLAAIAPVSSASAAALPDNANLKITYDGRASGVAKIKDQSRNSSISIGGFRMNIQGTRDIAVQASYHAVVTYTGADVSGVETQTSDSPFLNGSFTFHGTRQGDTCTLIYRDGAQVTARCTTDEFSYDQATSDPSGQSTQIHFAGAPTETVDLAEEARKAQAAQQAEQARIAAARAAYEALPNAGPKLTKMLDGFVQTDSQGWAFNRYAAGSMHDVKVVSGSVASGNYGLRGYYSYASGASGWVMVQMRNNAFGCIEFWDAIIGCRGLRTPEQGQAMRDFATGLLTGGGSSSEGSGRGRDCMSDPSCRGEVQRHMDEQNRRDYPALYGPPPGGG